ncbi:class A beta-lactamase [Brevundimonas guildfordensis]|uniref:Beta-lactamase n=1 Tax=Brevundimonas guildfordensis TaxID=2762241 RepID=A0ABR8R2H1_9CAUL|nr:class A beta-lactamase [Brevundimonas guildfordensis]MBD7941994.1 class A beta-lactamase [Brevundimonas guildfordensis]
MRADRRTLLIGAGALALGGCARATEPAAVEPVALDLDLSALEARHGGRLGVSVASEGKRAAWRGDERFVYCSTFKMYLAAATLLRVQAGQERLDRAIPVTQADMISHAPVTEPAVGSTLTIEQLMKGTVEVSDNPAANILIREMGGVDALRAFYRGIGDDSTRVDRLEPELNVADDDKDTITPHQSVQNIQRLLVDANTPLNPESKALLMRWLVDSPSGAGRIKAGAPAGWTVAHKTGTGGYGPVNDIGLILPPDGEPIAIAVYFHATKDSTDAQREAVIADATRLALKALGHG